MATLTAWAFPRSAMPRRLCNSCNSCRRRSSSTSRMRRSCCPGKLGRRNPRPGQPEQPDWRWGAGRGVWGMLFGLLFFVPLLAAVGAAMGALTGSMSDVGSMTTSSTA